MSDDNDEGAEIIPFPNAQEREARHAPEEEAAYDEYELTVPEEAPAVARFHPTIAQERQYALGVKIGSELNENRGDIMALGGLLRRFDIEGVIGHNIEEEAFEAIAEALNTYASSILGPVLPLLVEKGFETWLEEQVGG